MKEIIKHWTREPSLDRPKLLFDPYPDGSRVVMPQQVGFVNEHGTPIEISKSMAEKLGLIAIGEIRALSMPVSDWIELQEKSNY